MTTTNRKKFIGGSAAIIVAVFVIAAFMIKMDQASQSSTDIVQDGIQGENYSDTLEYDGKIWKYNKNIMSILLIGVDSRGKLKSSSSFGEAGQADSIGLLILDNEKKTIQILPISRDTMTDVHSYTKHGYDNGVVNTHLGYAFTFGDGGTASCKNTCLAVSDLLKSVRVHYYMATSMDSIVGINEILGGVTVTVPNNDIVHLHPECTTGAEITLDANNVNDFIRYRNTSVDFSNNGRMERNRAYYEGMIARLQSYGEKDIESLWSKIQNESNNILTSFSKGKYFEIMGDIHSYTYDKTTGTLKIAGKDEVVDNHDAFYADEKALMDLVVKTFYIEKN